MTKAELIERYGEEWYERHKERTRENAYKYYRENLEKETERYRKYRAEHTAERKEYCEKNAVIYRINSRDRNRLVAMGKVSGDQVIHHLKYHKDRNDETWIDDIMIMTREEHDLWHMNHPDFVAMENVV